MRHVVEIHVLPDTYSGGRSDGPAATKQLLLALVDILITTTLLNNNITEHPTDYLSHNIEGTQQENSTEFRSTLIESISPSGFRISSTACFQASCCLQAAILPLLQR